MIIRAGSVVTMDGPPIENGAVAISGNRIADVGKISDLQKAHPNEEVVDLGERALLPGLINTHCHLDYTCLRGKILRGKSFTDWIRAINTEKAKLSSEDYLRSIDDGFAEAKRFGTTTVANLTAFPELTAQVSEPIRTWWFAELIDVRDPSEANAFVESAVEHLKSRPRWGLAPHAPFTASLNLYRRCEEIAQRERALLTTHLAESRDEMSMFRDASGPLYEFLKEFGRDMRDCGQSTPVEQFVGRFGEASLPNWLVAHLNELSEDDLDLLKQSGGKFSVVHCPRSHAYFGHSSFEFEILRKLGFNICLGTDSLASNDDLSLFAEMRAFRKAFPEVPSDEILKMVTVNAARSLGQENVLGKIRSGFVADLIAVPYERSTLVSETMIGFETFASWSMIGGAIQKAV
jgi:aminodeoxyfutalosine deaminase